MRTITDLPTTSPPCRAAKENYLGWTVVRLANGILELLVVPEIGGRVIQLRVGGLDLLYVNPRHAGRVYRPEENNFNAGWKNYGGSKVWPAPQGWSSDAEWPGPPDPVLDGGAYSCRILDDKSESAAVLLESPADAYTGLTFARELRIFQDSTTVHIIPTALHWSFGLTVAVPIRFTATEWRRRRTPTAAIRSWKLKCSARWRSCNPVKSTLSTPPGIARR